MMGLEYSKQIFVASAGFAVSLWGSIAGLVDIHTVKEAVDGGVLGLLILACVLTFGVLVFIYHSMIALYNKMLNERDNRIESLEAQLDVERAKRQ